jgi:NADPH:quinone reductase-like Zn-dependent oxidoreductase
MAGNKIPAAMTAIGYDEPGGPEYAPRPSVPMPGAGEVLSKVLYAGGEPPGDQREGKYPPPRGIGNAGLEVRVMSWRQASAQNIIVGQQVCALVTSDSCTEYLPHKGGSLFAVPEGMSLAAEAAAIPKRFSPFGTTMFERGWSYEERNIAPAWRHQRYRHDGHQAGSAVLVSRPS